MKKLSLVLAAALILFTATNTTNASWASVDIPQGQSCPSGTRPLKDVLRADGMKSCGVILSGFASPALAAAVRHDIAAAKK